jgi:hypothetical protein
LGRGGTIATRARPGGQTALGLAVLRSDANVQALTAVNEAIDELVVQQETHVADIATQSQAESRRALQIVIGLTIAGVLFGFVMVFWLARSPAGGVKQVRATLI